MKTIDKVLKIIILLVGLGFITASIVLQIIGFVNDKFFERFVAGMFFISIYAILRKLK